MLIITNILEIIMLIMLVMLIMLIMVEMDLFSISVRSSKNPRPAVVPPSPVRYASLCHHHHHHHHRRNHHHEMNYISIITCVFDIMLYHIYGEPYIFPRQWFGRLKYIIRQKK